MITLMNTFWAIVAAAGFGACILANYLTRAR